MGIANIINTSGGGGGGSSEIITHLVNSVDGAGLRLANSASIKCNDVAANRFGTADFSIEFVISQNAEALNSDIFTSSADYTTPANPQATSAAVVRWDVLGNGNLSLVFFNSTGTGTTYDFGVSLTADVDKPTHFVVSADRSANAVLFRNGAEVASVDISASSSENIGVGGHPAVVGLPNTLGFKGNIYRLRTYSKLLSSDEAKNVFDRADVPTALVSNLLLDLDCAYANPTQSTVIQDRGPNNQDGTLNGTITQTNVIKQLNSTSARIGTTQADPADGQLIADSLKVGSGDVSPDGSPTLLVTDTSAGGSVIVRGQSPILAFDKTSGGTATILTDGGGLNVKDGTLDSHGNTHLAISSTGAVVVGDTPNAASGAISDLHVNKAAGGTLVLSRTTGDNNGTLGTVRFGNTDTDSTLANIIATEAGSKTSSKLEFQTQTAGQAAATRLTIGSDGLCTFANGIAFNQTNSTVGGSITSTLSHYEQGTFTPTDASTDMLTFTSVACNYTRIGRVVILTGSFVYPTTSGSAQARVTPGTLPFPATGNTAGTMTIATVVGGGGIDTSGYIRKEDNGVFTNANLSGATIYFNTTYIV